MCVFFVTSQRAKMMNKQTKEKKKASFISASAVITPLYHTMAVFSHLGRRLLRTARHLPRSLLLNSRPSPHCHARTLFRSFSEEPGGQNRAARATNTADVCLAGVLQDSCVKSSRGRARAICLGCGLNVFRSGGISLERASDFS